MSNKRGKAIDNTHLSMDLAETRGFIHRDYIAHCLRWSHVAGFLSQKKRYLSADILDIGCGKDVPLLRLLYSSRLIPVTGSYTGIDYNYLEKPFNMGKFPYELIGSTDVCEWDDRGDTFAVITCFEVLEHVEPGHSFRMLKRMRELVEDGGDIFISTPCFNGQAAANHVNEMTFEALKAMIQLAGLKIQNVYGTFASIRDYKGYIARDGLQTLFDKLSAYYDTNYLSTIFAPLYPEHARNALWHLKKGPDLPLEVKETLVGQLAEDKNRSSSEVWPEFVESMKEQIHE